MSFLKSIWKNSSKHKKLSEELGLQNAKEIEAQQPDTPESDKDVMTFKLKYLGSKVVEKLVGDNINPEIVKSFIKMAKTSGKKLQRVNVAISLKGIYVTDIKGNDMFEVSIYRISNCSTDKIHRQVFSFISIDATETMECHAFWCSKRKMAEMVALTVAHAFSTAYENWRLLPNVSEFEKNGHVQAENMKNTLNNMKNSLMENDVSEPSKIEEKDQIIEEKLIDFDDEPVTEVGIDISYTITSSNPLCGEDLNVKNQWVCFDDDFGSAFHDDFKSDIQNAFQCDFKNNFQNESHWRNNANNKIDLFFS